MPKSLEGLRTSSYLNSTSSLAVFYVEQVALNRHVSPCLRLAPFILKLGVIVKAKVPDVRANNIFPLFCVKAIGYRQIQIFTRTRPEGQLSLAAHRLAGATPALLECYTFRW